MEEKKEIIESSGFHVVGFVFAALCFMAAVFEYLRNFGKDPLNEAFPLITINALFLIYFGVGILRARARAQEPKSPKPKGD